MALLVPEFIQNQQYSSLRDRVILSRQLTPFKGVMGDTDMKVSQRGAGANMSVDVNAGSAMVEAEPASISGFYHCQNTGTENVVVTAAHATLPRIDQVILKVNDSIEGTGGPDGAVFQVLAGTATSGATLANRNGAVSTLPDDSIRLADILVPAASSSVTTANIRDRRPWARGARSHKLLTGVADRTFSSTSAQLIATELDTRLEVPATSRSLMVRFYSTYSQNNNNPIQFLLYVDGALWSPGGVVQRGVRTASVMVTEQHTWYLTGLSAGSHTFNIYTISPNSSINTIYFTGANFASLTVEEFQAGNSQNS